MNIEIEHKYLVDFDKWRLVKPERSAVIMQAYLSTDAEKSIRIRVMDEKGYITIKGKTTSASRPEFEFEIPKNDAEELIERFCIRKIIKTRHYIHYHSKLWEVDEFRDENEGLIIAEIELQSETETYDQPDWIIKDVTSDYRYSNSQLFEKPYKTWQK